MNYGDISLIESRISTIFFIEYRNTAAQHVEDMGGGGGYFKLINKTSWQLRALFLQIAGALVATLCQDQALKLVRIHNKELHLLWLCVSLECPCFTYKYLHTMRITMDYT